MDKLFADIETHTEDYLAQLVRAAGQPSVASENLGIREMADMLSEMLRALGFQVEQMSTDGAPVVLAQMKGRGEKTLLFYNHYDVQPADPLEEWHTPPFEPIMREGKLYARGVADNKGATVARMGAIASYLRIRGELPVNLIWVIEGEEEVGSTHLHQFVEAKQDLLRTPFGCLWEAGGKNALDRYEIALGCKGILYIELRTREASRDLHSALAATITNPAWRLLWALNSLKGPDGEIRIPGFYDNVRQPTAAQLKALNDWDYPEEKVKELYGIDSFLDGLTGLPLKERLIFGPTCNVDGFHSGYGGPGSKTVLPKEALAKVDFRLVPDQRPERVIELLRAHLDAEGFSDVEIAWWEGEAPSASDMSHPFVQKAVDVAEQIYGHRPAVLPMSAGSGPTHILCDQFGVPITSAGVGYADSRGHAPNENIRITDFVDHMRYVAALLDRFEHPPQSI